MSRNCEKHLVGLNRIQLEEHWDKERKRKRPHLSTLKTAAEVRAWIPSIKKDLDYCLQQLSGARKHDYPSYKIEEFNKRVKDLEREHRLFVKKVFELDTSQQGIPWEDRAYLPKRKLKSADSDSSHKKSPKTIKLNVLAVEKQEMTEGSSNSTSDDWTPAGSIVPPALK